MSGWISHRQVEDCRRSEWATLCAFRQGPADSDGQLFRPLTDPCRPVTGCNRGSVDGRLRENSRCTNMVSHADSATNPLANGCQSASVRCLSAVQARSVRNSCTSSATSSKPREHTLPRVRTHCNLSGPFWAAEQCPRGRENSASTARTWASILRCRMQDIGDEVKVKIQRAIDGTATVARFRNALKCHQRLLCRNSTSRGPYAVPQGHSD
jgi:hypothetical protein